MYLMNTICEHLNCYSNLISERKLSKKNIPKSMHIYVTNTKYGNQ